MAGFEQRRSIYLHAPFGHCKENNLGGVGSKARDARPRRKRLHWHRTAVTLEE